VRGDRAGVRRRGLVGVALLLVPAVASGQLGRLVSKGGADSGGGATVAPDSPRAAFAGWQRASRRGDWRAAAEYLRRTTREDSVRGPELAARLKAVLDRRLALSVDDVSPFALGDTTDGLDRALDRLGEFTTADGVVQRVRLERIAVGREPRWVFSTGTVERIDEWYTGLDDAWLRERLPPVLLRDGPGGAAWWQWLAIVVLVPLLGLAGWVVGRPFRALLGAVTRRTATPWDDALLGVLAGPFRLWIAATLAVPALSALGLNAGFEATCEAAARGLAWVAFFWAGLRAIRLVQGQLEQSAWGQAEPHTRGLVALGGRVLRVALGAAAVLTALAQFGYPVSTLLAGLGIGGVALALASQKTVEHLFGSVSLAADRTFRVGDFVRVDGTEGTVEAIGLRSTKVRTLERTLVRFPNGRLAEMKVETFGERDRIRLLAPFGVEFGTSAAAMRAILADVEAMLRAHPRIWGERVAVEFTGFGESSLDCRLICWFETTDIFEFGAIRSEVLLSVMGIVERHGSSFAFPTRTVRVAGASSPAGPLDVAAAGGVD
jgi:MscS family membrane protein